MRSWLLPGMVAGIMQLARLVGDSPEIYLPVIAAAFGLLASAPVVCCFLWARRWYGLAAAFAGAAFVAMAPELVYFGARTFSETVAAHLLVIACFLLCPADSMPSRRRLFAAGIPLGFVCLLRIHLAPAGMVVPLWAQPKISREPPAALVARRHLADAFRAVV